MRNTKSLTLAAAAALALAVAACTDRSDNGMATSPNLRRGAVGNVTLGACTTIAQLNALASSVFGAGSPNVSSVLGKLDNLRKKVDAGDVQGAQDQANNIVTFVQQKAAQGTLPGTQAQVTAFISGVLCFAGLSPDTFLILPTDDAQVRLASSGQSGVSLADHTVTVPTLLTITALPDTGTSPLDTKLDQYPTYISIQTSSGFTKPAVVALCPSAAVPAEVRSHLRVGHQAAAGFVVTPPADASFLPCSTSTAQSSMPGWLRTVASLILPKPLYAARFEFGGVGGLATEFSPFGIVDAELSFGGGVGGLATEFRRKGSSPSGLTPSLPNRHPTFKVEAGGASSVAGERAGVPAGRGTIAFSVAGGACTALTTTVGTPVEPECRPTITIATHNGTVMTNVPVGWQMLAGGGAIAPEALDTSACGAFGTSAATATDVAGKAGICWTLGTTTGDNTVAATPTFGGDAPDGVTFSPAGLTFTATAFKITPTASATGGAFSYDGAAHPGSGTCSDGLTPDVSYTGGAVPVNAGAYTVTVTCGAGLLIYNTVTATADLTITPAMTATTVSCPASVPYTGGAQTPCTASVTGAAGLNQSLAVSYANNQNAGTATASASYAATSNYQASSGSVTFAITKLAASATTGSATIEFGSSVPSLPCTVTGLLASESGAVTCVASVPPVTGAGTYSVVPALTPASPVNYSVTLVSGTLTVLPYVQVGCFSSPVYSVMPPSKSSQRQGSNLPVKCTLTNQAGVPVTTASGNIAVYDVGTAAATPPAEPAPNATPVFAGTNVFSVSNGGNYSYGLTTDNLISGHYYYVIATWSDQTTTKGWFRIK